MTESVAPETGRTTSSDGTDIGWRRFGSGPALVVLHGSLATGEDWRPVAELLADSFTVLLMDRRGRGLSGNATRHSLELETDDLRAVLAAVAADGHGRAAVLGHSFGAVVAAATAAAGAELGALLAYEAPLPLKGPLDTSDLPRVERHVDAGDLDAALAVALGLINVPAAAIAPLRRTPAWPRMAALTPTFAREYGALAGLVHDLDRFTRIEQRTLVMLGAESRGQPARTVVETGRLLTGGRPNARIVEFPGQGHFAHTSAPEMVADAVRSFLGSAPEAPTGQEASPAPEASPVAGPG